MNDVSKKKMATMVSRTLKIFLLALVSLVIVWGHASAEEDEENRESNTAMLQSRIDFGNAYIMGQSIKSGSVYLLHRKKSDIESMLKIRTDFRDEIIEDFSLEDTKLISQEAEADKNGYPTELHRKPGE